MARVRTLVLISVVGMLFPLGCDRDADSTTRVEPAPRQLESVADPDSAGTPQAAQPEVELASERAPEPDPGTIHVWRLTRDALPLPSPPGRSKWLAYGCEVTVPQSGHLTVTARLADGQHISSPSRISSPGRVEVALGLVRISGADVLEMLNPMLSPEEHRAFAEAVPAFEQRACYRLVVAKKSSFADASGGSSGTTTVGTMLPEVPDGAIHMMDGRGLSEDSPLVLEEGEEAAIGLWVLAPSRSGDDPTIMATSTDLRQREYEITIGDEHYTLDDYPYPFVELVIRWDSADAPEEPGAG
jgi:hypothetical protein